MEEFDHNIADYISSLDEIASTRYELPFHKFSFLEMRLEVTDAKIMLLTFCLFGSAAAEAVAA